MADMFNHLECPHCQAEWSKEEIEDQGCDACGWPDVKPNSAEGKDPDLMAPDKHELAERMHFYQQHLKHG